METSREVSGNTFGKDAKVLLGNITNNITTVNADPSAAHNAFLQGISETNPVDDKKRILESKGPLIYESYHWILEHNDFKKWRDDEKTGVFWIKGDPGKGKTMLLCGIIQDFENDSKVQERFAFFFCQGADARLNTATGIVKGLIYSVLRQNQKLLSNIQKQIEKEPKGYLEGTNAWAALGRIFTTIIQDPCMADFTFIIDALDECQHQESRKSLLNLIMETSNHVKWLISSRNEKEIERGLKSIENKLILELESNAAHISNAVDAYIDRCAQDIEALEDDADFRNKTIKVLKIKANGTFLWVTLVVQQLRDAGRPHVESILEEMPEDLESLYDEIMERSKKGWKNDKEACLVFLATVTAAKRPLHTSELYTFTSSQLTNTKVRYLPNDIEYLAKACGSFITITDNTIYFIHQSVKDYMVQKGAINIFPRGIADQHSKMFEISLKIMDKILRRNIYNIRSPGEHVDNITPPNPNPLASKEYFCAFWVDHLAHCHQSQLFQDVGILHSFLKEKYLYWLEAMILIKSLAQAVIAVQKLQNLIANYCIIEDNANPTSISPHLGKGKRGRVGHDQWIANTVRPERRPETLMKNERNETLELTRDVYRLVFSHRAIIEAFPLQIYASALTFCPSESILRKFFECPKWIVAKSEIRPSWSPCIQTIEDYESPVISVAISPDNTMLAAAAFHGIAKTWDLISGASLYSFETTNVTNVAFSPNSNQLALVVGEDLGPTYASIPVKVEIWDLITGTRLKTMDGGFESVSFSADGTLLALVGRNMIKIHNLATNVDLLTHTCHSDDVFRAVIFPSNCTQSESAFGDGGIVFQSLKSDDGAPVLAARAIRATLATSARETSSIEVLDLATGKCIQSIATDIYKYTKVSLSSDGMRLALAAGNASPISIWDIATGKCLQTLGGDSYAVRGMAFSADGLQLASTEGLDIYIWDIATCKRLQKFSGHAHYIRSLAYSLDGLRLVSGADDTTIKVWDLAANNSLQLFKSYPPPLEDMIMLITFSPGGRWVALVNYDNTVRLWDTATRTVLWGMKILGVINIIVFSPDNMQLAISTSDGRIGTISLWDVATGTRLRAFTGHTWDVVLIALSPRGTQLASASAHKSLRIWDTRAGTCLHTITTNCDVNSSIAFSPDGTKLGCVTNRGTIKMWDSFTGVCLQTLEDLPRLINDGFSWREYLLEKLFASSSQQQHSYYSYGVPELDISEDRTWILHGQNRALWLPPEYRPVRLKIHKNSVIIITKDNDFIHFEFCFEKLNI